MGKRLIIIILYILIFTNSKAQTKDTAYHYIGVGFGSLNTYGIIIPLLSHEPLYLKQFLNSNFEININYAFSKKHFYLRLENGIIPDTYFGTVFRTYPTFGYCTSTKKQVIWHCGVGIGSLIGTEKNEYSNLFSLSYISNTGFIISPFRSKRYTLGIDISAGRYKIKTKWPYNGPLTGQSSVDKGSILFYNLSICYNIKKKANLKLFKYSE